MPASPGKKASTYTSDDYLEGLPEKIMSLIKAESDRGVILILGAYIEELLGVLIARACVSPATATAILNHRQPAGDFESRILVAQAFGLIHEEDAKTLRLVQKMRNKAAHFDRTGRGFDVLFDSGPTADQVSELALAFGVEGGPRHPHIVRARFIMAVNALVVRLTLRRYEAQQASLPKSEAERVEMIFLKYKGTPAEQLLIDLKQKAAHEHSYLGAVAAFDTMVSIFTKGGATLTDEHLAWFASLILDPDGIRRFKEGMGDS